MDPPPLPHPVTPRRSRGDFRQYLHQLSVEHELGLPWDEQESPSRRQKCRELDIVEAIKFLYYKDADGLNTAIQEFRNWIPSFPTDEKKLSWLLERLTIAKTGCLKERSSRSVDRTPNRRFSPRSATNLVQPASPTLGIKHASQPSVEMPAEGPGNDHAHTRTLRKASLKRPLSSQALNDRLRASRAHPQQTSANANAARPATPPQDPFLSRVPPLSFPSPTQKTGLTSVNTSFATDGVTSANTSFWSDVQQGTQQHAPPDTPTSSVDDSFYSANEKSATIGGANDAMEAEDDYGTWPPFTSSGLLQLDGAGSPRQPPPDPSQCTDFEGSSAVEYYKDHVEGTSVTHTPTGIGNPQPQNQLPSPPDTDTPPTPHRLTGQNRVRQIPKDGLSGLQVPTWILDLPFELRWEVVRVLQTGEISADDLELSWKGFRDHESLLGLVRSRKIRFEASDRAAVEELTFAADLRWSRLPDGPVFCLRLLPLRKDKPNSFERHYGRHRVVILNIPSLTSLPEEMRLAHQRSAIAESVRLLLRQHLSLLGRTWHYFHVQPREPRLNDDDFSVAGGTQVYMFAERSDRGFEAVPSVKYEDLLNWWIPFSSNRDTLECKAYARLDLGVSRTDSVEILEEHNIECNAPDRLPTNDPDSTEFDDPDLKNPMLKSKEPMDDGCNRISLRVMRIVQKKYDLRYLPCVVQARIRGAKGMWVLDTCDDRIYEAVDSELANSTDITIGKSQTKIKYASEEALDPEKRSLNVNEYNRPAQPAAMYPSFIPILEDRRVPKAAIAEIAQEAVEGITREFVDALRDPAQMLHWVYTNFMSRAACRAESNTSIAEEFPLAKDERIVQMLNAGFEPATCRHLANIIHQLAKLYFLKTLRQRLKLPIAKSTMIYGICDPKDIVEPGTIHVGFLNGFDDGERVLNHLGGQALVGRLPALGRTDIQKVRCVFYPHLAHLHDVVVFSARGPRSLPSKLQGGDLDGDKFVIIWDPRLVKPFVNAPVMSEPESPAHFGITESNVCLGDVVPVDESGRFQDTDVANWLERNLQAKFRFDWVGKVTNAYDNEVYHSGSLTSPAALYLLSLHDYLLDAPKRGYAYDEVAWRQFCTTHKWKERQPPAWKQYLKADDISRLKPKKDNIADHVFFEVVEPVLQDAVKQAEQLAKTAWTRDEQLYPIFNHIRREHRVGSAGRDELDRLQDKIKDLRCKWEKGKKEWEESSDKTPAWRKLTKSAREEFKSIAPDDANAEIVKGWMTKIGEGPTMWDLLKASVLCVSNASAGLMFEAAGAELCRLKAEAIMGTQAMRADMASLYRPRPLKRKISD